MVSFAAIDNKTKDVLITVRRNLNISILDRNGDNAGRIAFMKTMFANRRTVFLSVYAPCCPDPTFCSEFTYLTDLTDFEIVMGTDMNTVMSNELDLVTIYFCTSRLFLLSNLINE